MKQTKRSPDKIMFKDGKKKFSIERKNGEFEVEIDMKEEDTFESLFTVSNIVSIIFWMKEADPLNPGAYEYEG